MGRLRQAEQTAAAKQVGVSELLFLGYPDGQVEATLELRKDLSRVIRMVRPDRVVCPSAERNYARIGTSHPDHRAVGSAALDAVYPDSRNQFAFPELLAEEKLEPWTVREVWISASPQPTHYVDITDQKSLLGFVTRMSNEWGGVAFVLGIAQWSAQQFARKEAEESPADRTPRVSAPASAPVSATQAAE